MHAAGWGPGDVALARADVTAALDGVERGLLEIAALRRRGVRVLNGPEALLAAHDKLQTARRLARAGIAHPRTVHVVGLEQLAALELPFVLKPRFGSWGADVMLCRSGADVQRCLSVLRERSWFRAQGVLAQEFVAPRGHDLRVIVARGRVVGAVQRRAAAGEWRTNVAFGACLVAVAPSAEACALAVAAARATGTDLAGIDLLPLARRRLRRPRGQRGGRLRRRVLAAGRQRLPRRRARARPHTAARRGGRRGPLKLTRRASKPVERNLFAGTSRRDGCPGKSWRAGG